MRNDRRSFITGGAIALLVAAAPAGATKLLRTIEPRGATERLRARLARGEHIADEYIELDKPLVLDFPTTGSMRRCVVVTAPDYEYGVDDAFVSVGPGFSGNLNLMDCEFKGLGKNMFELKGATGGHIYFSRCVFRNLSPYPEVFLISQTV